MTWQWTPPSSCSRSSPATTLLCPPLAARAKAGTATVVARAREPRAAAVRKDRSRDLPAAAVKRPTTREIHDSSLVSGWPRPSGTSWMPGPAASPVRETLARVTKVMRVMRVMMMMRETSRARTPATARMKGIRPRAATAQVRWETWTTSTIARRLPTPTLERKFPRGS